MLKIENADWHGTCHDAGNKEFGARQHEEIELESREKRTTAVPQHRFKDELVRATKVSREGRRHH
jgi:hypothetical protein